MVLRARGPIIREGIRFERVDRERQHAPIADQRHQFNETLWSEHRQRTSVGGLRETGRLQELPGNAVDQRLHGIAERRLLAIRQRLNHGTIKTSA